MKKVLQIQIHGEDLDFFGDGEVFYDEPLDAPPAQVHHA